MSARRSPVPRRYLIQPLEARLIPRPVLPVDPALIVGSALFQEGNFSEAAEIFERLSQSAQEKDDPRGAYLVLQAARARISAGQTDHGMDLIWQGLTELASLQLWSRLIRVGAGMVASLKSQKLAKEGRQVQEWIDQSVPGSTREFISMNRLDPATTPEEPIHCLSCGSLVFPGEVDWLVDGTAECVYCGNPIRRIPESL